MKELIEFLHTTWHQDVMTYQGYFALFLASLLYVYGLKKKNRLCGDTWDSVWDGFCFSVSCHLPGFVPDI